MSSQVWTQQQEVPISSTAHTHTENQYMPGRGGAPEIRTNPNSNPADHRISHVKASTQLRKGEANLQTPGTSIDEDLCPYLAVDNKGFLTTLLPLEPASALTVSRGYLTHAVIPDTKVKASTEWEHRGWHDAPAATQFNVTATQEL